MPPVNSLTQKSFKATQAILDNIDFDEDILHNQVHRYILQTDDNVDTETYDHIINFFQSA